MSAEDFQKMMEDQQVEFQAMREAYQANLATAQAAALQAQAQLEAQQPVAQPLQDQDAVPPPEIGSLAIRLPTFWTTSPELWFAQVEASFDTRNPKITSDISKYNHILQALPLEVLNECEEAVSSHGTDWYATMKDALLKVYGKSAATKNAELLEIETKTKTGKGTQGIKRSGGREIRPEQVTIC